MWSVTLEVLSLPFPLYLQLLFSLTPSMCPAPMVQRRGFMWSKGSVVVVFFVFLLRRTSPRLDQRWKWVFHCAEAMSPMVFSHNSLTAAGVRVLLFGNVWHKLCHRPIICGIVPFLIGLTGPVTGPSCFTCRHWHVLQRLKSFLLSYSVDTNSCLSLGCPTIEEQGIF